MFSCFQFPKRIMDKNVEVLKCFIEYVNSGNNSNVDLVFWVGKMCIFIITFAL